MEQYLMQFVLAFIILLLGAVGTRVVIIWRWLGNWMAKLDGKMERQDENFSAKMETQTASIIRIETRMENIDALRDSQKHDHDSIKVLDHAITALEHRVTRVEERVTEVGEFCKRIHGDRL